MLLPHGILAPSLSTVIFPMMARQFALNQMDDLMNTLRRALGPLVFLSIPAAISLFVFRVSVVQVVFQYGSFTPESTALVAEALGFFAIGLLARAVAEPVQRAFYAMLDTRTPLFIALLTIAVNITLSWLLTPRIGHAGPALSLSITYFLRMVVAAVLFTVVAIVLSGPLENLTNPAEGRAVWAYLAFAFALGSAAATHLAASYLLRVPEFQELIQTVQRRIRG